MYPIRLANVPLGVQGYPLASPVLDEVDLLEANPIYASVW